jgi:flagellar basal-body rod modification protein FlgD
MTMSVDSIGAVLSSSDDVNGVQQKGVNQQDFIKLFVSELQYQDPMQPLDNSQFLLQLAQFEGIALTGQTNQGIENLLSMSSSDQSVSLLNHSVDVANTDGTTTSGKVSAVEFTGSGVQLSVTSSTTGGVMTGVRLAQVSNVRP